MPLPASEPRLCGTCASTSEPPRPLAPGTAGSPGCAPGAPQPVCFRVRSNGKTTGGVSGNEPRQPPRGTALIQHWIIASGSWARGKLNWAQLSTLMGVMSIRAASHHTLCIPWLPSSVCRGDSVLTTSCRCRPRSDLDWIVLGGSPSSPSCRYVTVGLAGGAPPPRPTATAAEPLLLSEAQRWLCCIMIHFSLSPNRLRRQTTVYLRHPASHKGDAKCAIPIPRGVNHTY